MPADPLAPLAADPSVVAAVTSAREAVDRLLRHRVVRRRSAEVTAESSLRGARASAALDGAAVDLVALREALRAGGDVPAGPAVAARVVGAVRVHAGLAAPAEAFGRSPAQALARLHVLAARGLVDDDRLGRPRGDGAPVEDPLDLGPAVGAREAADRLDVLGQVVLSTSAPALVLGAVVAAELCVLRPFGSADGVVARAGLRLALLQRGLDPKALAVPEVGLLEELAEGTDLLRGWARGDAAAVTGWVAHVGRAVARGAQEGLAVCEAVQRGAGSPA